MASGGPSGYCDCCKALVYKVDEVRTIPGTMPTGTIWHRDCFKCSYPCCKRALNVKTWRAAPGKLLCTRHADSADVKEKLTARMETLEAPVFAGNISMHRVTYEYPTVPKTTMLSGIAKTAKGGKVDMDFSHTSTFRSTYATQ
jgi:hypothetical protein